MIAHHRESNTILQASFRSRSNKHHIPDFNSIIERPRQRGHKFNHHVMDNKYSADCKRFITEDWKDTFQLVPPYMYLCNIAKCAIHMFKAHFLEILAGVDSAFPQYLWDTLLPQTELTLNLLRRSMLNPLMSAWEHFNSAFEFSATPMGLMCCRVIIHNKPSKRKCWDQRGREGLYVRPALERYRCFKFVDSKTKSISISNTVKFMHS